MAKKTKKDDPKLYCWVVAYIDSEFIHKVESELRKYPEYNDIEAYIPTIRVLKKTFKGKDHFDEVPLLFNYGFFKIPRRYALHPNFLEAMKQHISCIFSWIKDPVKVLRKNKMHKVGEKKEVKVYTDYDIGYATATNQEISRLLKDAFKYSAHDATDLQQAGIGSIITLRGYPWEGIQAELVDIYHNKRQAKVKIQIFDQQKEITVSFDNVFFTMYKKSNYDDSVSTTESLDEMAGTNKLDKVMFKNQRNEGN